MTAPVLTKPNWLAQVHRDAISVALVVHGDYRAPHAGALAWRHGQKIGVAKYAAQLQTALREIGFDIRVPVFAADPGDVSDRYTLRSHALRLATNSSTICGAVVVSRWREHRPFTVAAGWRSVSGIDIDEVEPVAFQLLQKAGLLGAATTDGLVKRMREIGRTIDAIR